MVRQRDKNQGIVPAQFLRLHRPVLTKCLKLTLTTEMRQYTFDCYDIIEQSACLTQASKFYIALEKASMICNGSRIAA